MIHIYPYTLLKDSNEILQHALNLAETHLQSYNELRTESRLPNPQEDQLFILLSKCKARISAEASEYRDKLASREIQLLADATPKAEIVCDGNRRTIPIRKPCEDIDSPWITESFYRRSLIEWSRGKTMQTTADFDIAVATSDHCLVAIIKKI